MSAGTADGVAQDGAAGGRAVRAGAGAGGSADGSAGASTDASTDVIDLLHTAVRAVGGQPRKGQMEMAEAVTEAVASGRHLLVQAGTGTGKSLGYLVPLVHHAVTTGEAVVVSTATLALQAQVVGRDLPRLADALEPVLGRRPTFEIVKGRANYVCRHKLVGGFPPDDGADVLFEVDSGVDHPASGAGAGRRSAPGSASGSAPAGPASPSSRLGREVQRVRAWAEQTDTGDRDDLVPGVSARAWRQVSVSARECLGATRCPVADDCFVEASRARAREADVVVTNHALLAIDAFEGRAVLPEHDVVVVDEAHELADRVTSVVSGTLSGAAVAAAASSARKHAKAASSATDRLETAGDDLAAVLADLPAGRFPTGLPEALALTVASVRDAAREVLSALRPEPGTRGDDGVDGTGAGGRQVARAAVEEVFDVAERLAEADDREGPDVVWLAVTDSGPGGPRRWLEVAPLSVAGRLRDGLFGTRTAVLTSATLTLGGSFDATAGSVGLAGEDAPPHEAIDVGSPFDYPRQAILYTAAHLPPPGRDGTGAAAMEELAALVEAAGGRTLGLFSSRRAAEAAAEAMRERLDVPVLCQGDDTTPTLVRAFAADPATCLFGTLSLWQGVDVPGPSCQLVVVDRLPFPRPDDPLAAARTEAVARSGGNGFLSVSATQAALLLAQGAGRLVRSMSDRGVVAVLDSRLATARYGAFVRAALPPMWPTTDRAAVLAALRRIDA